MTCSFAFSKHRLGTLGPCWVRNGVRVGVLKAVREPLEFVGEQASIAVHCHRRRSVAELGGCPEFRGTSVAARCCTCWMAPANGDRRHCPR